jgi:amino acid transporter
MLDLLPPHYQEIPVTKQDLSIASICWGFSLGFGFLTTWEAFKQTRRARNPLKSVYVFMIWAELFVCLLFSIICWMHLDGGIKGR